MKHLIYIGGQQHSVSSELDYKFAIIGQRDLEKEYVAPPKPLTSGATEEDRATYDAAIQARKVFAGNEVAGRYTLKPLEYAETEREAKKKKSAWEKKGWVNVSVAPINESIPNA